VFVKEVVEEGFVSEEVVEGFVEEGFLSEKV
jgi:hypothetical protein